MFWPTGRGSRGRVSRLTSRKYWDEIKRDVKPIYTAVDAAAARSAFDELADKSGLGGPDLSYPAAMMSLCPRLHRRPRR
jgi:Transposase, Mutator family